MVQRLKVTAAIVTAAVLLAVASLAAGHSPAAGAAPGSTATSAAVAPGAGLPSLVAAPAVSVSTVVSGLSHPWDLTWVERSAALRPPGRPGVVEAGVGRTAARDDLRLPVDLREW